MDSKKLANDCAKSAKKKKALKVLVLDVRKLTPYFDYLVICSGRSTTQVRAISEEIEMSLKKEKKFNLHREGEKFAHWILMDYGGVVVHIFHEEERKFYNLEKIWGEGEKVRIIKTKRETTTNTKRKVHVKKRDRSNN